MERKLSGLNQELAKQSSKFKDDWPAIQELKNQITETNSQLNREKQTAIKSIITEYETAAKREKLLHGRWTRRFRPTCSRRALIQYNILQREVETNKNVYGMLSRLKEASVAAGLKSSNIRIVERAETPMAPSSRILFETCLWECSSVAARCRAGGSSSNTSTTP